MIDPETAKREVWEWLKGHFRRTGEALKIDAVVEGTALPQEAVGNALRLLADEGRIEANGLAELPYPIVVSRILYWDD